MRNDLLGIYESMKKGGNDLDDKDPTPLIDGGATKESGYNKSLNDTYDDMCSDEDEEDEDCECEEGCECDNCVTDEDEEVIFKESKKKSKPTLNTNMAKKSAFDKLYESVINENFGMEENEDLDALGLGDATPDSDLEDDFGDEEEGEDSVTFTLDRATAQSLVDVLQGVLGGEEEGDDLDFGDEEGEDDFGGDEEGFGEEDEEEDEEGDEEFDEEFDEDEERADTEYLGDKGSKLKSKSGAKVKGTLNKKGKSAANTKPTDKQGNDGDFGNAISGGKKPNMGECGKAKVSNLSKGSDFFK